MYTYIFEGIVLPERAQLTFKKTIEFTHISSSISGRADLSILLNKVCVWVDTQVEWDIFDLRNTVRYMVQNELSIIGYLYGYAYDLEIVRVLNRALNIDYVFGIDIGCIVERNSKINKEELMKVIRDKIQDDEGVFLHRCFSDLSMAIKVPEDTGFYCYRAIESLLQHCVAKFNLLSQGKPKQWQKLRDIAKCGKETILRIKNFADPTRHGNISLITSEERRELFIDTWNIVDEYLKNI